MFKNKHLLWGFLVAFVNMVFIGSTFALMPVATPKKINIQNKKKIVLKHPEEKVDTQSFLYKMDALNQKIQILEKEAKITELKEKINKIKNPKPPKISFSSIQKINTPKEQNLLRKKKNIKKIVKKKQFFKMPVVINEEGQGKKIFATLLYPNGHTRIVSIHEIITLAHKQFYIQDIDPRGVLLQDIKNPNKGLVLDLSYKLSHQIIIDPKPLLAPQNGRFGLDFLKNQNFSDSTYNKPKL